MCSGEATSVWNAPPPTQPIPLTPLPPPPPLQLLAMPSDPTRAAYTTKLRNSVGAKQSNPFNIFMPMNDKINDKSTADLRLMEIERMHERARIIGRYAEQRQLNATKRNAELEQFHRIEDISPSEVRQELAVPQPTPRMLALGVTQSDIDNMNITDAHMYFIVSMFQLSPNFDSVYDALAMFHVIENYPHRTAERMLRNTGMSRASGVPMVISAFDRAHRGETMEDVIVRGLTALQRGNVDTVRQFMPKFEHTGDDVKLLQELLNELQNNIP